MRRPHWDNNGVKKGSWSPDEDQKLTAYITRYGIWNWTLMPKYAGLSRNGKSCRLRWLNYLNPQNKRGNITKEEAHTIFNLYAKLGKRWSAIAAKLPGRTDNEIKNYWHTHFKKHLKEKALPKTEYEGIDLHSSIVDPLTLDSSSIVDVTSNSLKSTEDGVCNFWSQPFSYENNEQESHIHQARCHCPEPSSPYDFYNNEYCFCHLLEADDPDGWNEYRISSSSETILDN